MKSDQDKQRDSGFEQERLPEKSQEALPAHAQAPDDLELGAHDLGEGRVSFAIWAPWKKSVHVIGDFTNWELPGLPLAVSDQGVWWTIIDLPHGEHAYQFVIDGQQILSDPYARQLRWVDADQAQALVSVAAQAYSWNDADFQAVPFNNLVIYELHISDFSPQGTFRGVTAKLDYLRELGINAIQLMPVQEYPGDSGWGYNPAFFFAVEGSYGSINDLKELVDQAHQRQIAVIIDVVFNHTSSDNPIIALYPSEENPYLSHELNPWFMPDLGHQGEGMKRLVYDFQKYWLEEFHIDGFRYDNLEGIGYDDKNGATYMAETARQIKPHVYLIAEELPDPISVVHDTQVNGSWHLGFERMLIPQLREGDFEDKHYGDMQGLQAVIDFRSQGYSDNAQAVNYIESHDEERVCYAVQTNGFDYASALQKSKLGAVALFTACGVPMLYHGQEFGMDTPKTIDSNPLQWEKLDDPAIQDLWKTYQRLILLRHNEEALVQNNVEMLLADDERKLIVFRRWTELGNQIVVALNFSPSAQAVEIDFPRGGRWHEWISDGEQDFGEQTLQIMGIAASAAKVWIAL